MLYDPYRRLSGLILSGPWQREAMVGIIQSALKLRGDRSARLADAVLARWTLPYPPSEPGLAAILRQCRTIRRRDLPAVALPHPLPSPGFVADLPLPCLGTPEDLAEWLDLTTGQLHWLADCDGRVARCGDRQGHYNHLWFRKRSGGHRLIEAPLPRLKSVQRKVLADLVGLVPPHRDSFGFVKGRDCRSGAARHASEEVVLSFDLRDFFTSVPAARVHAIFRTLGYNHTIARLLTGLTTTRTDAGLVTVLPADARACWTAPHLPQGAPTSPALANLAARKLDVRLAALARRLGASYSRYADDLTFSGDRGIAFDAGRPVTEIVEEITRDTGFRLSHHKTRIRHRGCRQLVTGLVVNRHLNVTRTHFDRLKAILTNCVRHGPEGQNRENRADFRAWLEGHVGWVEAVNPARGARLRSTFDRIVWSA